MQTLIIILIVALIAKTCVFIYAEFFDVNTKREHAAVQESLTNQHADFLREKENFQKVLRAKDEIIEQLIEKKNKLDTELFETRKVNGLLKNRTAYIEGLKDSINQVAESSWDIKQYMPTKESMSSRQWFAEGVKVGAEWIAQCAGINVEFELDDRFKE